MVMKVEGARDYYVVSLQPSSGHRLALLGWRVLDGSRLAGATIVTRLACRVWWCKEDDGWEGI